MLAPTQISSIHQAPMPPWGKDPELAKEYADNPKEFLLDRCRLWMDGCHFMHNWVVCATYWLPAFDVLPSGMTWHRTDTSHDEAMWQGKVGLVIGKGPMAFVDEPENRVYFHGQNINIGDWVQWDIHDARQATINRVHCRYLKDVQIIAKVDDPRLIY